MSFDDFMCSIPPFSRFALRTNLLRAEGLLLQGYCFVRTSRFSQCKWATEMAWEINDKESCRASCPQNWVKLAVDPRNCRGQRGMEAFCCKGYTIPEPPPPPPPKSAALLDFELAVDRYVSQLLFDVTGIERKQIHESLRFQHLCCARQTNYGEVCEMDHQMEL
jgi:hypothetical protein